MYYLSNEILISLLKQYGIKRFVLSSGSRNIPFVSAVEKDDTFECFSVVDERNAAFFALGLCQQFNEPVVIACTSGTAASNYLTGVTEGFYSNARLIIVTFDRSPYMLNQLETQKINQPIIFSGVCKRSVTLPIIKDEDDIWYCQRLINEALIAMNQHGTGPIHINIPLIGGQNELVDASINHVEAENVRKIEYISADDDTAWRNMASSLNLASRVLVVMGQASNIDNRTKVALDTFFKVYQCPLLTDYLSNYRCSKKISAEAVIKALSIKKATHIIPDIVITFGCNFQERIKDILRGHKGEFQHWSIAPDGEIRDVFKSQSALFECKAYVFFEKMINLYNVNGADKTGYFNIWKKMENSIILPDMPFTNFYVVGELARIIPPDSILHLSILNSTRLMQFFELDESIKTYSNVNAFGIDGCLPTFMGQAYGTEKLAFLVIGDLSFFYSMNSLAIRHRKKNIRILLINNGGGAEFHIMPDSNSIPTIDLHIGAAHNRRAQGWAESMDYKYLSADSKESLEKALEYFIREDHEKPVLLEVFTNMKEDGEHLLSVYRYLENCIQPVIAELEDEQ